jgi:hypothetical protein
VTTSSENTAPFDELCGKPQAAVTLPSSPVEALHDCAFLVILVGLSVVFYVHRLGFTSDDWAFIGGFANAPDGSLLGLISIIEKQHLHPRPLHAVELAFLYWLFWTNPLGYHLVQTGVLATTAVLLYIVMRELRQPRLLALAVPAVYLTTPSYSAARFWYTGYLAALSGVLYLVTVYSDLRSVYARRLRWWLWRAAALLGLVASALTYEVSLPLFVLNPILASYHGRQLGIDSRWNRTRVRALAASTSLVLLAVCVYKYVTSERSTPQGGARHYFTYIAWRAINPWSPKEFYGFNLWQALDLHFGDYGVRLPWKLWYIASHYPSRTSAAVAGLVGVGVFAYLVRVASHTREPSPHHRPVWLMSLIGGLAVFPLGYAIFLLTPAIGFTSTGLWTRTAIAAAIGTSLIFAGAAGWVAIHLRSAPARARLFAGIVASLCASGVLILNTVASFYVAAYREAMTILANVRHDISTLPPRSVLILDGVCPHVGPGVVFESNWDLEGALRMIYLEPTLRADIVTPRMHIGDHSLSTTIYQANERHYLYGPLYIYHPGRHSVREIDNAEEARRYFSDFNPDLTSGCPPGREGHGVSIF